MADLVWTCNKGAQEEFLFGDLGQVREVLFGGQKGGGKSGAIGPKAYMHIAENPGDARVLILRETFGELQDLIDVMDPQCRAQGAKWNEQKKVWTFPCGAKIRFGHLGDGCRPYWGREFSLIIIDELTRCIHSEADYMMLLGSLRNSRGVRCQVIAMSNPGGPGHAWVKARFMSVPPKTIVTDERTGLERVFIPAGLAENEHNLGVEYRLTLEQLPEAEREAYLYGNWDAFEGKVFKLQPGVHLVQKQDIPADWTRFRSMDWGYARPFAIYWYAVDYEGRAWVYREWYGVAKDGKGGFIANEGARIEPEKVAEKIAAIEKAAGEEVIGIADPACWAKGQGDHGGGPSIVEAMQKHGVFWQKGKNDRIQGKMQVHQRLRYELAEDGRVLESPGLFIVQEACPHLVRTLPALEYDAHRIEDVDTDGEDHAYDSLRYFCMARPWAPKQAKKTDGWRDRQNTPNRTWEWG